MQLEPILRALAPMKIVRPPLLWEADTEHVSLLALLREITAAAVSTGVPLERVTLQASNTVFEDPGDEEEPIIPDPGEYVAVTVSGPGRLGPDETWHPEARGLGHLSRLHDLLEAAGVRFAYVRSIPPDASVTILLPRLAEPAQR